MNDIKRTKFNICILGETTVGKTCIIESLSGKPFNEGKLATIGVDNVNHKTTIDGNKYIFKIFDTAGQERYKSIAGSTIKVADGFILVFSVDNKNSFDKISEWIDNIEQFIDRKEKILILFGNKIDINERQVSNEEAIKFAKERNMKYFETSAKTGFGIQNAFNQVFRDIYELNIKKKEDNKNKKDNMNSNQNIVINNEKHERKKSNCC